MGEFTHLHLHTQYSLLDGAIRLKDLFPKVLELGMDSVAATDHGNMFGAVDFYTRAKEHGVKPIFGCETYVAASDRTGLGRTIQSHHTRPAYRGLHPCRCRVCCSARAREAGHTRRIHRIRQSCSRCRPCLYTG